MFKVTVILHIDKTMNICQNMFGEMFFLPELISGSLKTPFYAVISDQMKDIKDFSPLWGEDISGSFKVIGAAFQRKRDMLDWLTIPAMKSCEQYEPDAEWLELVS